MSVQLKELRERAAASTAALRAMTAQGDEVEALVQRKRSLKPLVVELRSEVRPQRPQRPAAHTARCAAGVCGAAEPARTLYTQADTLTRRLKDSSTVVQRVVESVRVLDTAQANTRRALERTVDIVGLKTCVEQVTAAMQVERVRQRCGRDRARGSEAVRGCPRSERGAVWLKTGGGLGEGGRRDAAALEGGAAAGRRQQRGGCNAGAAAVACRNADDHTG